MSLAAVNQICVVHEAMNGCKTYKASLKDCFENVNIKKYKKNLLLNWPCREKTCLRGFADNKDADQPAHPRSLIGAFVIRFLKSIIYFLATSEMFYYLAGLYS